MEKMKLDPELVRQEIRELEARIRINEYNISNLNQVLEQDNQMLVKAKNALAKLEGGISDVD